jgi:hypothetical protein
MGGRCEEQEDEDEDEEWEGGREGHNISFTLITKNFRHRATKTAAAR